MAVRAGGILVCALGWLAACGGAPPRPAAADSGMPGGDSRAGATVASNSGETRPSRKRARLEEHAGPAKRSPRSHRARKLARADSAAVVSRDGAFQPRTVDVDRLPVLRELPELHYKDAPRQLPPAAQSPLLLEPTTVPTWRARPNARRSVHVRVRGGGLARIQLGSPSSDRGGNDKVHRRCGAAQLQRDSMTPARWDRFELGDGDEPRYVVTNAWFDSKSCNAATVTSVEVRPATLVEGLLYGFISVCRDCATPRRLSLLMPPTRDAAVDVVGDSASTTHGSFTVVSLPLHRGAAGAFTATLRNHAISSWARKLGIEAVSGANVRIGMDVAQAVGESEPIAIVYAQTHRTSETTRRNARARHRSRRQAPKLPRPRPRKHQRSDIFGFR